MAMLGSILLACAFAQDAPQTKAPDAALFDELIRKTNELHSFRVEYELRPAGEQEPKHVRMLYKSPGTGRLDIAGQTLCRIQDGFFDIRCTTADGKAAYGHFDAVGLCRGRLKRLADAVRTEFVELSDSLSALEVGNLRFDLSVVDPSAPEGKTIDIKLGFALVGEPLFGWLDSLRRRESPHEDNDKLVFEHPGGAKLVLSTRTGFVESVEKTKKEGLFTLTLVDLDCDPKLDASDFELPEPAADAIDNSTDLAEQMQEVQTSVERNWIIARIAYLASEMKFELNADHRAHLGKLLEGMYADGLALEKASSLALTRQKIERLAAGIRKEVARLAKGDDKSRAELERFIEEQRTTLAESLGREMKALGSRLTIGESVVADATLRKSLGDIEAQAASAAFERVVNDVVLEYFDDQVQRAKDGG